MQRKFETMRREKEGDENRTRRVLEGGSVVCANPRQFSKLLLASGSCGAPWYRIHKYINDL